MDHQNRQYILQREYICSDNFFVKKYLNDGQVYLTKSNNENAVQQQEGNNKQFVQYLGKYIPQGTYILQESHRQYVQKEEYRLQNYQPRNYNQIPGSYSQQRGNAYQKSGQYDHQPRRYNQQSVQHNQQSRYYNEDGYAPNSGKEQLFGKDQHTRKVYLDDQNRQYILQREYIGSEYFPVRRYLIDGQVYLSKSINANAVQQQGKYVPQKQYFGQESIEPQRQYAYVQPKGYKSQNNQPQNYNHRPESYGQQSENSYQQSGQDDQKSWQYDHQPRLYNHQSRQHNQQSRRLRSIFRKSTTLWAKPTYPIVLSGRQESSIHLGKEVCRQLFGSGEKVPCQ